MAALFLFIAAESSRAQTFSIDWHSVDGGGSASAGGGYSLNGTIGQPDGSTMSGGGYSLAGGFWSVVQMPGAPFLTVRLSAGRAMVSWPSPSSGFVLQQNANLNTANWVPAAETVTDNGTNKFITVNSPAGNRFYRLFKP